MKITLAPMLKVTTPSFRKFIRTISNETELFTEMIVDNTVLNMSDLNLLKKIGEYDANTVVQLGGSDPEKLAKAVKKINKSLGFTKFNLNCGCPSSKVQKGCFGAILMTFKGLVSKIINRIYEETGLIISIKCRIGVDNQESFDFFNDFVNDIYVNTPCREIYVHARKCILSGLSPKSNRNIPPLNYEFAYKIKNSYPDLKVYLNGGIKNVSDLEHLKNLDGFMIGRQAMNDVFIFYYFDEIIKNRNISKYQSPDMSEKENIENYKCQIHKTDMRIKKIESIMKYLKIFDKMEIVRMCHVLPILNVFKGLHGCKKYKNAIDTIMKKQMIVDEAISILDPIFEEIVNYEYS